MSNKEETLLARQCMKWLLLNKGYGWHVNGSILQPSGEPDIDGYIYSDVLNKYIHLKIELKTDNGVTSARQGLRLTEYNLAGYCVGVARSLQEFISVIRNYENGMKT